ncbi:lipoprotein [gut metagenome]|uniref:Lipoprotein n=1 Tax=gut metagenome TaxID=749906 RepID=J9FV97_9ZZZZ
MVSCQKSQEYYEGVFVVGADKLLPIANLTVDELPSAIGVKVASSCKVEEDVQVEMKASPELVESFNQAYKKNYELLPQGSYQLENTQLTIEHGNSTSTGGVRLSIISRDGLKEGKTYVLPVSIGSVSGQGLSVVEGSRTLYIVVKQIIVTQAADISNNGGYFKVDFRKESKYNTVALKNATFEARVRFKKMNKDSRKWCFSVMGLEENFCLRTAGSSNDGWKLQLSGKSPALDSRDVLPNDKWIHLACVYDGSQGKKFIYIDGELQGELADTRGTLDLTSAYGHDPNAAFYIGQSAADNRFMDGYVSEVRVWATARSAADLKNNICWVDPLSEGLVAYWRFNEPSAENPNVITDLTGNGYDAKYAGWGGFSFVQGVRCPDTAE